MQSKPLPTTHSHMWLVGVAGLCAGLVLMIYVPTLKGISSTMLLFAGFHLIGAIIALASLTMAFGRRLRFGRRPVARESMPDFGWAPAWTLGPLLAASVFAAAAVAMQVAAPLWWPAAAVLWWLSAACFAGSRLTLASSDPQFAPLPMVNLLQGGRGTILDGGCGAGRTTLAVASALPEATLVALDRFDSSYIEDGGRPLLERNIRLAGLEDRCRVVQGDLTDLPFEDDSFDAIVSAHAMDHLGQATDTGMREMWRVLKPGRHFLLVVWVPGWAMFAVASLLSFLLAGKGKWRARVRQLGFEPLREGSLNGYWFLLLRKPEASQAG